MGHSNHFWQWSSKQYSCKRQNQQVMDKLARRKGVKIWLDEGGKESMWERIIVKICSKAFIFRNLVL